MTDKWRKARAGLLSGIRGRLTFWFVFGAVGAVIVGGAVVYLSGLKSIQGSLGQTYCQIASRIVGQADGRFTRAADRLGAIATDVLTTEDQSNARERSRMDTRRRLLEVELPFGCGRHSCRLFLSLHVIGQMLGPIRRCTGHQ